MAKRISTTVYLEPWQDVELRSLKEKTGVNVAEFVRMGVDMLLEHSKGLHHPTPNAIRDRLRRSTGMGEGS